MRPAELHSRSAEENCMTENVSSRPSVKVATPPCAANAAIPCGLAVRKQHKMLFAASKFENEKLNLTEECDCMKCPCCGKEMTSGIVQSARQIFFTTKAHKNWFIPDTAGNEEIVLSSHNWTRPTCTAYHCAECKKVVVDYSAEVK